MMMLGWLRSRSTIRLPRASQLDRHRGSWHRLVLYAWLSMLASSITYRPSSSHRS